MGLFLDYAFMPLPDVVDRSAFTSGYSYNWFLLFVLCLYGKTSLFLLRVAVRVTECFTQVTLPNPQYKLADALNKVDCCMTR